MALTTAQRAAVEAFRAMDVLAAANKLEAEGRSILHLEVGQPAAAAPPVVVAAAQACLARGRIGYTDALGTPALRQALADHYREIYGQQVDPGRIAVTAGSSGGFLLSLLAAFDPGARIGLAAPGYPAYKNLAIALGLEPVFLPTTAADHYQPSAAQITAYPERLDGLIVASPSNPTGTMLAPEALKDLAAACRARGTRLISDEIYHGITYGPTAHSLATEPDVIVANSFSKYYCMAGWRLGWLVLPEDLVRPLERLAQSLFISASELAQAAGLAALTARADLDQIVAGYRINRDLLVAGLPQLGLSGFLPSDGAFYLYLDVSHLTNDSSQLCSDLLQQAGVAVTPGLDFDPAEGKRTLRLSYAGARETMEAALERLGGWLETRSTAR
ncbi:MAG: aminotransferase class I/II-fold pyridoxal phosphate-dependent enzyme [Pseudomonadota bacterium]